MLHSPPFFWQRNCCEHVIGNEYDLTLTGKFLINNHRNCESDCEHSNRSAWVKGIFRVLDRGIRPGVDMKRKDDFLLQNVGGQDLLVPLGSKVLDMNGLVVLNPTGRYIWELLAEDRSLEDLVTAVVDRFEVETDRAGADVRAFVDDLSRQGWIDI